MRSSDSEDGAVGDALRDGGGGLVLVTIGHLAFACREPWWRTQDGNQSEETRHHTCSCWTSGRGLREGLGVLTEPR